ncbi:MAG: MBL fold metallo-hydrolase [Candidatus Kerfeldbacteria bacterium]|nr:MBL fold metallo-hydrolase [Candidatus Kerfeldbacteria bacterium]
MTIEWFGKTCVRLATSEATVVVDPLDSASGLKVPKLSADLVLATNQRISPKTVGGEPFVITGPGEYEVKKVFVYGLAVSNEQADRRTMYLIEAEGLSCAHLGQLGHQLTNGELERLEGVDILFIPVGGHGSLNAEQAASVISAVEPRVVIPMQYRIPGLKENLDTVHAFAKEMGVKESEAVGKFKVTARDVPQDKMQVVMLTP